MDTRVVRCLTAEPSAVTAVAEVARLLSESLSADGCLVFRVEPNGDLSLIAGHPTPPPLPTDPLRIPAGTGVMGRVAVDGIPAVLLADNPRTPAYRRAIGLADGRTVSRLVVPARLPDSRCVAVVALHSLAPREFTEAETAAAEGIAGLIALRVYADAATDLIDDYRRHWDAIVATTVTAQEQERRRVANDLHDGVTQTIAGLTFHLSAAELALEDKDLGDVRAQLAAARELTDLAFGETRAAITGLHSPVLQDLGLAAGLTSMARSVPNLPIEVDAEDLDLPEHVAISLFRVAQESVNNAVKHATATRIELRLVKRGRLVTLTISDDGQGFEAPPGPAATLRSPLANSGYGLDGMAERVRLLGGELTIRSSPGVGTTVEATVPG